MMEHWLKFLGVFMQSQNTNNIQAVSVLKAMFAQIYYIKIEHILAVTIYFIPQPPAHTDPPDKSHSLLQVYYFGSYLPAMLPIELNWKYFTNISPNQSNNQAFKMFMSFKVTLTRNQQLLKISEQMHRAVPRQQPAAFQYALMFMSVAFLCLAHFILFPPA